MHRIRSNLLSLVFVSTLENIGKEGLFCSHYDSESGNTGSEFNCWHVCILCKLLNDWIKSYLLEKMLREPLMDSCIRYLIITLNPHKYCPHFINEVK